MSSDAYPVDPPGIGKVRPDEPIAADGNHLEYWNVAIQNALDNFGRAPGLYRAELHLSATIDVRNPGNVVEYIAKFI
jgi:hypothetical protein